MVEKVNPYYSLVRIYDQLMEQTGQYYNFFPYIQKLWERYNCSPKKVLDVACGTGVLAIPLAQLGLEIVGYDISEKMVGEARKKAVKEGVVVRFFTGDMAKFKLDEEFDAAYCFGDSINYILSKEEVNKAFGLIGSMLRPGSLFIFDLITEDYLLKFFHDQKFTGTIDGINYSWDNDFSIEEKICTSTTVLSDAQNNTVFEEVHLQKIYSVTEIKQMLQDNEFEVLGIHDLFSMEPGNEKESERLFFVARKEDA